MSSLATIKKLTQIGLSLSKEKEISRLLSIIINEAMALTKADAGTIYIMDEKNDRLNFAIIENRTLNIKRDCFREQTTWPPVMLYKKDGTPNYENVSSYVALRKITLNISDVYNEKGFNFDGTKRFDSTTGYRSKSMLVVPMLNHENEVIGVLQLINAVNKSGRVMPFTKRSSELAESLASQAAVALTNNMLIKDLENLFESFIETIAQAIDEKSPYTANHVKRVETLAMAIAKAINQEKEGRFSSIDFKDEDLRELRIAALLHDVGKITTPEHIMDKATKLETVFDRIELIRLRFEIFKLKNRLDEKTEKMLDEDFEFIKNVNMGRDFLDEKGIARLKAIKEMGIITEEELEMLSVRRGTLTDKERAIINNHARVTHSILSKLLFPRKLKNVPLFASLHHEKLNGMGYPFGLKGEEIPLQARIITICDIFEALIAKDRPYRSKEGLDKVLEIMEKMVEEGHIDAEIWKLFKENKVYQAIITSHN